jgi:succinate dehydrogenase / fumarate reductase cytochrome b subunit
MSRPERPLSPHLQIYRWELTMALSILHRMTGVGLMLGLVALVGWLIALMAGPASFAMVNGWLASPVGLLLLCLWTLSLFLHLGNGVRHLFWDFGLGFELATARRSGWFVLVFTLVATALTWWFARGGGA